MKKQIAVSEHTSLGDRILLFIERYEPELPAIIFVRRKIECVSLAESLDEVFEGRVGGVDWVTGDKVGAEREAVAEGLRSGRLAIVVATNCWETGIDIPGLKSVVVAAGGSAPIAAKQRPGRGTRLSADKHEFVIYDLSIGGKESQRRRQQHYQDGGYDVEAPAKRPADVDHDLNALLLGSDVRNRTGRAERAERAPRKVDAAQQHGVELVQECEERQPWREDVDELIQFVFKPMPLPKAVTHNVWLNWICGIVLGVYFLYILCQ
jgi:superfamily II DNA or RNA helicase